MSFLNGQCLIAMPGMQDERFEKSVIYICAHTDDGAMGLVVNKPIKDLSFTALLEQLHIEEPDSFDAPSVYAGGPVDVARGFVLHSPEYTSMATLQMNAIASLTVTTDIIRDITLGKGPKNYMITLGHAGWGPNQLENELKENSWLPVEASNELLYTLPAERKWAFALNTLGIDPSRLSFEQGKA